MYPRGWEAPLSDRQVAATGGAVNCKCHGGAYSPAMRGLTRRWVFRCGRGAGRRDRPLAERVLAARGLDDAERANLFLNPRLVQMHDPSLIPDLDRAAERLLEAVRRRERVVIYGDYDVDGVTATAILYHILRAIEPEGDVSTYVPHRLEEGYGLNCEAISRLAEDGARVIVSVDCGITALEPAVTARDAGVNLIITDHHNPPASLADLPPAFAVVHPRRPDSAYPFGHLCGAGVAYKLAWRLATMHCGGERVNAELRDLLVELLAFAALGSVADVVPLVDENRVLARFGLGRMAQTKLRGLQALLEASGLLGASVDSYAAGFRLAPRLNAAGRLGHAREAVELFTTATGGRAAEIAARLTDQNQRRQSVERAIAEQACEMVEAAGMHKEERRAIVLAHPDWHPGVIGIVCSRLVERYCRPTVLMQRGTVASGEGEEVVCRGSGRSIDGFNLHEALSQCSDLFTSFGGHDMAAGLAMPAANLETFTERFTAIANASIAPDRLLHDVSIDALTTIDELLPETVVELEKMAPFGPGNPSVNVLIRGAELAAPLRLLGRTGKHASLHLVQNGRHMRAVAWGWGERADELHRGMKLDLVVRPQLSTFDGRVSVEPEVKDLRLQSAAVDDLGAMGETAAAEV